MTKAKAQKAAEAKPVQGGNVVVIDHGKGLIKRIDGYIAKVAKLTTTELHELAMACLKHFEQHGDTGPTLRLVNGLPRSLRRLELMRWFTTFGPYKTGKRDKADLFESLTKDTSDKAKPFDIEGASQVPFYDAPEAVKPKGIIDTIKQLTQQAASYRKMVADKGIARKGNISDEELESAAKELDATVAFLNGRKAK